MSLANTPPQFRKPRVGGSWEVFDASLSTTNNNKTQQEGCTDVTLLQLLSLAEMPPSVTPESLERNTSADSLHSSSQSMQHQNEHHRNYEAMNKNIAVYRGYGDCNHSDEDEDDGCGDIALLERPSWTDSLRRLHICCPGVPGVPSRKDGVEHRVRTQSESTESSQSSRQLSPVPIAPAYPFEVPQQTPYPPHPQGWYATPPGYPPAPYSSHGYAAWGYPQPGGVPYPVPSQHNGIFYPPPPPQLFQNSKSYGYALDPSPQRKNTAPEPFLGSSPYDSGTESEVSRKSKSQRPGSSTPKQQRRLSKPPLVQRRATAPVQSSSSPFLATRKESIDQPLMPPPLPPKQSSRKNVFVAARPRLPSEMSRTSVNTTNSRHRRQAHETFEFSTNSLRDIAAEGPVPVGPPPLNFIELQDSPFQQQNSWSSWDDQTQNDDDDHSMLLSPDEDEVAGYISPVDEEGASPAGFKMSPAKSKPDDWMVEWAQEKSTMDPPMSPAVSRVSEAPPVPTKDTAKGPVYLPISQEWDKAVVEAGGTLVFSGWVAISEGDSMRNKLGMAEKNEVPIEHKDICYLQLVQEDAKKYLKIHQSEDEIKIVPLSRSLQAQGQEVNGRAGRCVLLQDCWTRRIQWTILPVSLPTYFFREGRLLSERNFAILQSAMFTPFYNATTGTPEEWSEEFVARRYAPDEQHDAAMHILFCMDAALSAAS
eukprot:scaffold11639_cov172-Amphora_coffeaeformis.AAC.15